ncbi:MAG: GAF domain-containing protein [Terriglobales bacterium]
MTRQSTSSPRTNLLDEGSFQELLAAAFVLQQHNQLARELSTVPAEALPEIIRIQRRIRSSQLNPVETAQLICQQVEKFTEAGGVAIGIIAGKELIYLAATGSASHDLGRRLPIELSLPAHCIKSELTFQSFCTQDDPRLHPSLFAEAEVGSFIAIPVEFENKVVGVLEARFDTPNAFKQDDVRTCELLAVLVNEVITRAGKPKATKDNGQPKPLSVSPDASIVVSAPETTAALSADGENALPSAYSDPVIEVSSETELSPAQTIEIEEEPSVKSAGESASPEPAPCRGCGQNLGDDELFCGKCGTERSIKPDGPLQSKWASLWYMKQARKAVDEPESEAVSADEDAASISPAHDIAIPKRDALVSTSSASLKNQTVESPESLVHMEWLPDLPESKAENWLSRQWRVNRANFYVAGASLLLLVALSGWGSVPAVYAPGAAPQLSLFDRMLVSLGIAEAPDTPVYRGNPDTPVWVDMHTALYYCPGSDLYGKTDGGKIATQRSAQMDQFEPAHRRACN